MTIQGVWTVYCDDCGCPGPEGYDEDDAWSGAERGGWRAGRNCHLCPDCASPVQEGDEDGS